MQAKHHIYHGTHSICDVDNLDRWMDVVLAGLACVLVDPPLCEELFSKGA